MPDGLAISKLTKHYGNLVAVRSVSLQIARGKVLALLGPSGSGKTTILRLIAGFEQPDTGTISVREREVTGMGPAQRRIGMVFQNYALFPHLNVFENVSFGLDADMTRKERASRVAEVLELVDLPGFETRAVTELSGGQQQRVAVARAVAPKPDILLFDEPLSNLDPALRERTRRELRRSIDQIDVTTVFVTHEQEEAFALGDEIAVLRNGSLEQVATPSDLYEKPASVFVASFVGRASRLEGRVVSSERVAVGDAEWPFTSPARLVSGDQVLIAVRPEALRVTDGDGLSGTVEDVRYTGARAFFEVATPAGVVELEASIHTVKVGDRVRLSAVSSHAFPVNAE